MENLQVFLNENLKKGKQLLTVQAGIFSFLIFKVIYHSFLKKDKIEIKLKKLLYPGFIQVDFFQIFIFYQDKG